MRRNSLGRIAALAVAVGAMSAVFVASTAAVGATGTTTASNISTAKDAKLGTILVAGDTVYTLQASKTACTAQCLKAWPPVLLAQGVTTARAGTGVDASKLGTASAANGARQVTYSGKRLYWYVKDTAPGQVHGNVTNKWGKWSVVTAKSSSGSDKSKPSTGGSGF